MTKYSQSDQIKSILDKSKTVVIMQADNPDGDSLASALALEQILDSLSIEPILYCGVDIPSYLRYLDGWDRVAKDIPNQFDASIIVDSSTMSLFETLEKSGKTGWVASKPCVIIDHHAVDVSILFASVICNHKAVATGEIIFELSKDLEWNLNHKAKKMLAVSILSDSLGLISEGTTARSIHIIGELVEDGVKLAELENSRRELMRKSTNIIRYKGQLLQRIEYNSNNRIATITIPWQEIEKYSHEYNPSMLVIDDMRLTEGTDVAIAFKVYRDGHVTGKIRCNYNKAIANKLAEHFGGGGHVYASGFKIKDGRSLNDIKSECIIVATELLDNLTN